MNAKITCLVAPVVSATTFIAFWYGVRGMMPADKKFMLPLPHDVATALVENHTVLLHASLNIALGASIGLATATVLAVGLAILMSTSGFIRTSLYPHLMMLQMMPVIALAPILVIWVGPGLPSVSIITFLICFFPLVVNTTQGLLSTDQKLVEMFDLYRASRWQQIRRLRIPAAMPYFFTGLRISGILASIGAIVGDFSAGSSANDGAGLGFLIIIYGAQFKMAELFATVISGCLVGFSFVLVVHRMSWFFLHQWHDSYERSDR
ncbi:MAG: ABC transporter permease [Candidatus Synoicihabitans palmerolidicus]|nr:ABC transporter permease [Candidatus Synoicihabitans palmerolidicus]